MKVTSFWTAVGALFFGVIIADLVHNPRGTRVLANNAIAGERVATGALLGKSAA